MNNCFFISEGAFTFKVEGTGVVTRRFFVSGGSEVIIVVSINKNIEYIESHSKTNAKNLQRQRRPYTVVIC